MASRWIQGNTSLLTMPVPEWWEKDTVDDTVELRKVLALHLRDLLKEDLDWVNEPEINTPEENEQAKMQVVKDALRVLNQNDMAIYAEAKKLVELDELEIETGILMDDVLWSKLMLADSMELPTKVIPEEEVSEGSSGSLMEWVATLADM